MSNFFLKKLSPKRLFHRLILIFLVPLIVTQISVIFFFYERHWEKIINRFANIAANEITLMVNELEKNRVDNAKQIATNLNLILYEKNIEGQKIKNFGVFEKKIKEIIQNRVSRTQEVIFLEEEVLFKYYINNQNFIISFPKKYLLSQTPIILFLWMISISLILSLIAFLFLRNQMRAIQKLAMSAEDFGKGKEIKIFKPTGAMEIRQAGNAFLKMRRRINNYMSQRTSFLAGISHDLGTIITRIKLRLELVEKTENIKQIKNDVDIMQNFLKEYLDFAETVNINKIVKINLSLLISEVIKSSNFKNKKIEVTCPKNYFISTDKSCLYRIIFNLYENAIKFGTLVKIEVIKQTNYYMIFIKDNGPGVPYQQRGKIFKPFFKIDDSRNLDKGGSGLGLSIASELSKKIKAKISLRPNKSDGAIFLIQIPLKY
ncbi:MAG: HAMP domain-containing sensor histidine kinase [Alphaproteobacteria bacterium]